VDVLAIAEVPLVDHATPELALTSTLAAKPVALDHAALALSAVDTDALFHAAELSLASDMDATAHAVTALHALLDALFLAAQEATAPL